MSKSNIQILRNGECARGHSKDASRTRYAGLLGTGSKVANHQRFGIFLGAPDIRERFVDGNLVKREVLVVRPDSKISGTHLDT
jgi:hypothetical protein